MKTNEIKVSVLMPSLNVAKYIGQCLKSVTEQTIKEIEIICIDAGSTDGTRKILNDYAQRDGRIRVIDSPVRSYGYQMNLGMDAAHGIYTGIVETDDFIDSQTYEDLYKVAHTNAADIVRANYYEYRDDVGNVFFDNTKLKRHLKNLPADRVLSVKEYPELLLQSYSIWSGIYSTEFLNKNNIRFLETKGAAFQDIGFFLKSCLCANRVILTDSAYLHYRTDNMNSSSNSRDSVFAVCDEHEEMDKFIREHDLPITEEVLKALVAARAVDYLWNYLRISVADRKAFTEKIQKDFSDIPRDYIQKNVFLSNVVKKDLWRILDDPEAYVRYRKTALSRFVHDADDNGLLYTMKNLLFVMRNDRKIVNENGILGDGL